MKRFLAAVLALLAALPGHARELRGIKGDDDRLTVAADQYPWSAVGRLNNGLGGHCSGILIGPSLVATAAHCLYNRKTRAVIPVSSLTFVAGYDRGSYLKASKVVRMHPAPGWSFDGKERLGSRIHDWALLELAEPVGEAAGWVGLDGGIRSGMAVVAVGFGRDRAHVPAAHIGCRIKGGRLGAWETDCDAVQGGSGGPLLVWRDGVPLLVGLNVAVLLDGSEAGIAVGVDALSQKSRSLGPMLAGRPGQSSRPLAPEVRMLLDDVNWKQ